MQCSRPIRDKQPDTGFEHKCMKSGKLGVTRLWAGLVDAAGGEEAQAKLPNAVCSLASRSHRHCAQHSSSVSRLDIAALKEASSGAWPRISPLSPL